jgi:hypothetical protein
MQMTQAVLVRRRAELIDQLAPIPQNTNIDALAAEIETSMQHWNWASFGGSLVDA